MLNPLHTSSQSASRRGFTLLEMLISVALVLVLMLAITKIFSITGAAIGASQGFSAATRDARAAQAVFAHDIASIASDSPFIWIRYDTPQPAFRNKIDEQGDRDYVTSSNTAASTVAQNNAKYTIDLNNNGVEGEVSVNGEQIGPFDLNFRNHRQDRFSFCARDRFYRQTGNTVGNTLVSDISSAEAWINYGQLTLPHPNSVFKLNGDTASGLKTNPGDGTAQTNPQNFYASQWILGREAIVMVLPTNAPSSTPASEYIKDANGVLQEFIKKASSWTSGTTFSPFSAASRANYPNPTGATIQSARYDMIGIDITNARKILTTNIAAAPVTPWYLNMLTSRFEVNPFVIKPINADNSSQQVPVFIPACSQFVVEYAGDFLSQNANGTVNYKVDPTTGTPVIVSGKNVLADPDGQVDFNVVNGVRQIQWYGMPRAMNGSGTVSAANGDVVPLADFVHYLTGNFIGNPTSQYATYADLTTVGFDAFERFAATKTLVDSYIATTPFPAILCAAWGPADTNRPKMYRITLTIDRPEMAGRTNDGMTFEYVFNAP